MTWHLEKRPYEHLVKTSDDKLVATVEDPQHAKSIASVPLMLKAIQAVIEEVDGDFAPYSMDSYLPVHLIDKLKRAYREATGVDL